MKRSALIWKWFCLSKSCVICHHWLSSLDGLLSVLVIDCFWAGVCHYFLCWHDSLTVLLVQTLMCYGLFDIFVFLLLFGLFCISSRLKKAKICKFLVISCEFLKVWCDWSLSAEPIHLNPAKAISRRAQRHQSQDHLKEELICFWMDWPPAADRPCQSAALVPVKGIQAVAIVMAWGSALHLNH